MELRSELNAIISVRSRAGWLAGWLAGAALACPASFDSTRAGSCLHETGPAAGCARRSWPARPGQQAAQGRDPLDGALLLACWGHGQARPCRGRQLGGRSAQGTQGTRGARSKAWGRVEGLWPWPWPWPSESVRRSQELGGGRGPGRPWQSRAEQSCDQPQGLRLTLDGERLAIGCWECAPRFRIAEAEAGGGRRRRGGGRGPCPIQAIPDDEPSDTASGRWGRADSGFFCCVEQVDNGWMDERCSAAQHSAAQTRPPAALSSDRPGLT